MPDNKFTIEKTIGTLTITSPRSGEDERRQLRINSALCIAGGLLSFSFAAGAIAWVSGGLDNVLGLGRHVSAGGFDSALVFIPALIAYIFGIGWGNTVVYLRYTKAIFTSSDLSVGTYSDEYGYANERIPFISPCTYTLSKNGSVLIQTVKKTGGGLARTLGDTMAGKRQTWKELVYIGNAGGQNTIFSDEEGHRFDENDLDTVSHTIQNFIKDI